MHFPAFMTTVYRATTVLICQDHNVQD